MKETENQPKLTKDNEVIISLENIPSGQDLLKMSKQAAFDAGIAYQKSLEKKTYTRDEIKKAFLAGCDPEIRDFDKWIEQNL